MQRRQILFGATGGALLLGASASARALALRAAETPTNRAPPTAVTPAEHARTIAAMRPPKRSRPVVAVLGQNDGTEVTDYVIPYAVLRQSGVADVFALATEARPLQFTPALRIEPQATITAFDGRHPDGADYVIVPALHHRNHPAAVAWIKAQAAKGATLVGVCSGVKTLSAAALLSERRATGHWFDIKELRQANPGMTWVRDRRYVADRGVVTTPGVSASLPVSLAIVAAIVAAPRRT